MLAKILIIEDDLNEGELIKFRLEEEGYDVGVATDGADGLKQAFAWKPDLILLDVMMPTMSGWTVCERLRHFTDTPIIFLTVLDQEKHVIRGLELGADDYVTKPYDYHVLLARIEAVLRRHAMKDLPLAGIYAYGDLRIDFDRYQVTRAHKLISLSPLEFKLLRCLAERAGRSCSHSYLLRRVWGSDQHNRSSLKLYIWYLRKKLERDPSDPKVILTEHGVGYRLSAPLEQERPHDPS
jgi:two-component system KDP operon response regulator KdpE